LKVPGLALVELMAISRGAASAAHDAPLAPRRGSRAAQAAQTGMLERLDHRLGVAGAIETLLQQA
jgi:hypothetical protein